MKILFCTHDGKNVINGVNVWLLNLLPALQNRGFEVSVIIFAWSPENECTTIPLLKAVNIECTTIKGKRYTEREVRWILEHIQAKQPDIFICNNLLQASYASKWIQQAGIPTVAVLHNDDLEYEALLDEFATGKNGYKFSAIVAVSEILMSKLSLYPADIVKKRIPCGVQIPGIKNTYKKGQTFKIAYIGRLSQEQKNIAKVIRSFCETVTKLPDIEAYVYGSGPDIEVLHQILNEFNYPDRVIVKGNLTPSEIQNELTQLHAIILMSDYEGLPVSLMEAMAFGVVPVCTRIKSGVPELLIENVTGIYIDEPSDLTYKLSYLKEDPGKWELLSTNARKHIEQGFSAQICNEVWIRLLNELAPAKKQAVKIPHKIRLPATNINLALFDNREPNILKKAWRKFKRELTK